MTIAIEARRKRGPVVVNLEVIQLVLVAISNFGESGMLRGDIGTWFRTHIWSNFSKMTTSRRRRPTGRIGLIINLQNSHHLRRAEDVNMFYGLDRTCSAATVSKKGGGRRT